MSPKTKRRLWLAAGALAVFYVVTHPVEAAAAVDGSLDWLQDAAEAIITFVRNLFA